MDPDVNMREYYTLRFRKRLPTGVVVEDAFYFKKEAYNEAVATYNAMRADDVMYPSASLWATKQVA
jgi:hypothetical protein